MQTLPWHGSYGAGTTTWSTCCIADFLSQTPTPSMRMHGPFFVHSTTQVPVKAAQSKRGYGVRVLILSRHIVRPNDFLGQADVPLSLLQVTTTFATGFLLSSVEHCRRDYLFVFDAPHRRSGGGVSIAGVRMRVHQTFCFVDFYVDGCRYASFIPGIILRLTLFVPQFPHFPAALPSSIGFVLLDTLKYPLNYCNRLSNYNLQVVCTPKRGSSYKGV